MRRGRIGVSSALARKAWSEPISAATEIAEHDIFTSLAGFRQSL